MGKKTGPKKKPAKLKRRNMVSFRVTDDELRVLKAQAKAAGHDEPGTWLRELGLGRTP